MNHIPVNPINTWSYPLRMLLIVVTGTILCWVFSTSNDSECFISYMNCSVCYGLLIGVSTYILSGNVRYSGLIFALYIIKQGLGISHYLTFIDPQYFTGDGSLPKTMWREQRAIFNAINELSTRKFNGIFIPYMTKYELDVTHTELLSIIAVCLRCFGAKALNFLPLNSFFALLIAVNFKLLCEHFHYDKRTSNYIFWATALFPIFLFDDHVWRDVVGISLIVCSLTGYFLSDKKPVKIFFFFLLIATTFIHRSMYVLVVIGSAGLIFVHNLHNKKSKIVIIIILCAALLSGLLLLGALESDTYLSKAFDLKRIWTFPIKIILGIIGPFPWSQCCAYKISPESSYQIGNYIMGVFQLGTLIYLVLNYHKLKWRLDFVSLFALGLMFPAFLITHLDQNYVAQGFLFLLFWLAPQIRARRFVHSLVFALLFLIVLNVIVINIGGIGISRLWT